MMDTKSYADRVVNSALWSAYGDALGFITEFRDKPQELKSLFGDQIVSQTVQWKRRVGGKSGAQAILPAGCYSDDTQLRLATSRAIRPDGSFNIEAFAKMELPVWLSYSLGAGRGTKAAASNLSRDGVSWFSNFYETEVATYTSGGGNGASMRIQPHIWSAPTNSSFSDILGDIFRNAISTHGNLRGIVGAVFHSMCLWHARERGVVPTLQDCEQLILDLSTLLNTVEHDQDVRMFWLPSWEARCGLQFDIALTQAQSELLDDLRTIRQIEVKNPCENYRQAVRDIGAYDLALRGSGTKTALLAAYASSLFEKIGIEEAIICTVNTLGSDTDSIASMTGAIMGFNVLTQPTNQLMDKQYIVDQALRMAKISVGDVVAQTPYPNLLQWKPPRTQQDAVYIIDGHIAVLLFGAVIDEGERFETRPQDISFWQWLVVESGQTLLLKRRRNLVKMPTILRNTVSASHSNGKVPVVHKLDDGHIIPENGKTIDELTRRVIQSEFDASLIGEDLLRFAEYPDGVEKAIAYASIIAKAKMAQLKRIGKE